jgi:hypothetical protein
MKSRQSTTILFVLSFAAVLGVAGSGDAPAAALESRLTVPISGTVDGGAESVSLSGSLLIVSEAIAADTTLASPKARLAIAVVNVSGVGLMSGAKYVVTGEDRLLRQLSLSDHLDVLFPFYRVSDGPASARSAMASITLTFDLTARSLKSATATFGAPKLPG